MLIRTVEWARKFLDEGMYLPIDEEVMNFCLAFAILQIASTDSIRKQVLDGLKAIALLVEQKQGDRTTELIATAVAEKVTLSLQNFIMDIIMPAAEEAETMKNLHQAAVSLTWTVEEQCEELQQVAEQILEVLNTLSQHPKLAPSVPETMPMYASIMQQPPPPPGHADTIARGMNM
jgi:hypothetical protein